MISRWFLSKGKAVLGAVSVLTLLTMLAISPWAQAQGLGSTQTNPASTPSALAAEADEEDGEGLPGEVTIEAAPSAPIAVELTPQTSPSAPIPPVLKLAKANPGQDGIPRHGATEPTDPDTVLRCQIFLDSIWFGPGKVDGVMGEFTRKAVELFNQAVGEPDLLAWDRVLHEAQNHVNVLRVEYEIQKSDFKHVTPDLPTSPEAQSKVKYMGYRSVLELVSERYHTDENYLERLNPGRKLYSLKAGDKIWVPNVEPFSIDAVPRYHKFEKDESFPARVVEVDTKERLAIFWEGEALVAAFPITPGQPKFIPRGTWKMVNMVTTPTFRWDKSLLQTGKRSSVAHQLPLGPNSPVGIFWAGLSKSGIGLHGTATPRTIGRSQSAGCVRFANWDIIRLPNLVRPGVTVVVK